MACAAGALLNKKEESMEETDLIILDEGMGVEELAENTTCCKTGTAKNSFR
jgi:hypothetical protein